MHKNTKLVIILSIAILLVLAVGCEQPKKKVKKPLKKLSNLTNHSAATDIQALLNVTQEAEEEASVNTTGMTDQCSIVLNQLEFDIAEARNASKVLDQELAAKTNAFVSAQEDYEQALAARNPSQINIANATLRRVQAEWEAAKDKANDGRDDVRRLKLSLVKAKDDCDPNYVPPIANATLPQTPESTPQSQCDRNEMDTIAMEYNRLKARLDGKEEDINALRDQKDELEEQLETAQEANNTAEIGNVQDDINEKDEQIAELQEEIDQLNAELDDKRDELNQERLQCGLASLSASQDNNEEDEICERYDEEGVQEDLDEANQELEDLREELEQAEDERDAAEDAGDDDRVDELEDDIDDIQDDINEKENEIEELEHRLDVLQNC
ncbi:hypothetical protein HY488_03325 [Candidatus Woesearchaeota archaeon]|nr:hypothetical protein [Candidatus Woesearchaeota archaeon]